MSTVVYEWDDFGASHEISDMCQSHDCRDQLLRLKELNPDFKATLFAIPAEMTMELQQWCANNDSWIELAVHGFLHSSNYECEKWTYEQMDSAMSIVAQMGCFTKCFRAPGWQISDDVLRWLADNNWVIADQSYNDDRRPGYALAYVNNNGQFTVHKRVGNDENVEAYHGHSWNVGGVGSVPANGIYEDFDNVKEKVLASTEFKFISELFI